MLCLRQFDRVYCFKNHKIWERLCSWSFYSCTWDKSPACDSGVPSGPPFPANRLWKLQWRTSALSPAHHNSVASRENLASNYLSARTCTFSTRQYVFGGWGRTRLDQRLTARPGPRASVSGRGESNYLHLQIYPPGPWSPRTIPTSSPTSCKTSF